MMPLEVVHRSRQRPLGLLGKQGFTVTEVLVAASILVMALLGIASMMPTADMSLHQSGQISKAISLAQEMIEMIRNDPFHTLTNYAGVDTRTSSTIPVDDTSGSPPFLGGSNVNKWANDIALYLATGAGITGGYGTIAVSAVATDASGNDVLRKVTVTVCWTDSGRPYQVKLEALVSGI